MTKEEYQKKYPKHFFIGDHCYTITEASREVAKMLDSQYAHITQLFYIDVHKDEIEFGSVTLNEEQIQDIVNLKNALVKEYQISRKRYKEKEEKEKREEKKKMLKYNIEWRKGKIKNMEEELKKQKALLRYNEKDLETLEKQDDKES